TLQYVLALFGRDSMRCKQHACSGRRRERFPRAPGIRQALEGRARGLCKYDGNWRSVWPQSRAQMPRCVAFVGLAIQLEPQRTMGERFEGGFGLFIGAGDDRRIVSVQDALGQHAASLEDARVALCGKQFHVSRSLTAKIQTPIIRALFEPYECGVK